MIRVHFTRLFWLLSVPLLLTGCLRLEKPYPQKNSYALELPRSVPAQQPLSQGVLQIRKFDSAPAYRSKGFVYRTGPQSWHSDYYHQFFVQPAAMITELCRRRLQQRELFDQINQGGYPPASELLQGRIVALYGDYRPDHPPMAVLELQLTLIDERSAPTRPLLDRIYRRSLPLADRTPASLVDAWSKALAEILDEFEIQLQQMQSSHTQQQGSAS